MLNFRFPSCFFVIGIVLFLLTLFSVIIAKARGVHVETIQVIATDVMLIGLLFCSLARDENEDEMTLPLRLKSFSLAFICGVVYALVIPYIEFGVDFIMSGRDAALEKVDVSPILIFMLGIRIMFFHTIKRLS